MSPPFRSMLVVAVLVLLSACKGDVVRNTAPRDITPETLGYYCQMNLLEHPGPKAQVFLDGNAEPLFFSQVRDAIAFMRGPEQVAPILAVYVNDMGARGATWDRPGDGNWIVAEKAFYVVGSARTGGMGAPETVPFSSRERAEAFVLAEGGDVLMLNDITEDMVLAPVEAGADHTTDDQEFDDRLRVLPNKVGG